ncbi:MAG: hypothetical protein HYV03_01385 [Deltaproteobacteria bacterium]|nr:hypothetical protein [Deltaproteobacteria bacterium]
MAFPKSIDDYTCTVVRGHDFLKDRPLIQVTCKKIPSGGGNDPSDFYMVGRPSNEEHPARARGLAIGRVGKVFECFQASNDKDKYCGDKGIVLQPAQEQRMQEWFSTQVRKAEAYYSDFLKALNSGLVSRDTKSVIFLRPDGRKQRYFHLRFSYGADTYFVGLEMRDALCPDLRPGDLTSEGAKTYSELISRYGVVACGLTVFQIMPLQNPSRTGYLEVFSVMDSQFLLPNAETIIKISAGN